MQWQERITLPIARATRTKTVQWVNALTYDPDEEVLWKFPKTHLYALLDLGEEVQAAMFYRGAFQPEVFAVFQRHLPSHGIFVDVGAHIGQYTLWAAYHGVPVIAFEPDPDTFWRLKRNVHSNTLGHLVTLYQGAVSHEEGQTSFFPGSDCQRGGGSLVLHVREHRRSAQRGTMLHVPCVTVDGWFRQAPPTSPIGLIKLDIEGAELLALRGAAETIRTYHPVLILEVAPEYMRSFGYGYADLCAFLDEFGYERFLINADGSLTPEQHGTIAMGQFVDMICVPYKMTVRGR